MQKFHFINTPDSEILGKISKRTSTAPNAEQQFVAQACQVLGQRRTKNICCIAICTHNRAGQLGRCLKGLNLQDMAGFEILVIANHCKDDTVETAETILSSTETHYRIIEEPKKGLSHARNRALQEADSPWVFFLDDDGIPNDGFVAAIRKNISGNEFDCFGGTYYPSYPTEKPTWFIDEFGSNGQLLPKRGPLLQGFLSGGIMGIRRELAIALGGFSLTLGMSGKILGYGEEVELQVRLRKLGYLIGYDPTLTMDHDVAQHKYSIAWFYTSGLRQGLDAKDTLHEWAELWFLSQLKELFRVLFPAQTQGKFFFTTKIAISARSLGRLLGYSLSLIKDPKRHFIFFRTEFPLLMRYVSGRSSIANSLLTIRSMLLEIRDRIPFRNIDQAPFHIVTTCHNCEEFITECLRSVSNQKYDPKKVKHWIIDDASTDRTVETIENWIQDHPEYNILFLKNDKRLGGTTNTKTGFNSAQPGDIIIELNGDDALSDPYVLKYLARTFHSKDVWFSYNMARMKSTKKVFAWGGYPQHIIQSNAYRSWNWSVGHLRPAFPDLLTSIV